MPAIILSLYGIYPRLTDAINLEKIVLASSFVMLVRENQYYIRNFWYF